MTSRSRSLSGAALMLLLIPIFAGLLACMPVPIGDPERSRVDPDLTGVWAVLSGDASADDAGFYVFEPYDKRTWLIVGSGLVAGDDSDLSDYDLSTYAGFVELAASEDVDEDHVYIEAIALYKAWVKKLGGELFMTWEPKLVLDNGIPEPEVWLVYRIIKEGPDSFRMRLVNGDSPLFKDVKETRRAYERVIRKNVHNEELYDDWDDDAIGEQLVRVQKSEMEFFEDLLDSVISWE